MATIEDRDDNESSKIEQQKAPLSIESGAFCVAMRGLLV
jgi:hypothetical protein